MIKCNICGEEFFPQDCDCPECQDSMITASAGSYIEQSNRIKTLEAWVEQFKQLIKTDLNA